MLCSRSVWTSHVARPAHPSPPTPHPARRPSFKWKEGQTPEQVDWLGQKLQIDAAKAAGVRQVVLVGSMGGTDPENMLNKLVGDDGGNILQWKRRAEQYLVGSGLEYTIIHPGGVYVWGGGWLGVGGGTLGVLSGVGQRHGFGVCAFRQSTYSTRVPKTTARLPPPGLIDKEAGKRRLVVAVDDALLKRTSRSIPRGDVAALAVGCIGLPAARNVAFDVCSDAEGEGEPTADLGALVGSLNGASCDYGINSQAAAVVSA